MGALARIFHEIFSLKIYLHMKNNNLQNIWEEKSEVQFVPEVFYAVF
jgi:hypothetical protein